MSGGKQMPEEWGESDMQAYWRDHPEKVHEFARKMDAVDLRLNLSARSWVIWLRDGRYTYAWGNTADEARAAHLKDWEAGIDRIVPASETPDQPPPGKYVPTVRRNG